MRHDYARILQQQFQATTPIPKVLKVLVVSFENEESRELECRERGEWRKNLGIRREVDGSGSAM